MQSIEKKKERILKHITKNFSESHLEWCKEQENDEFEPFGNYDLFLEFQKVVLNKQRECYLDMLLCLISFKPSICDLETSYSRRCDGFYFNASEELVIFHDR